MKKLLPLIIVLLTSTVLFAQTDDSTATESNYKTIFKSSDQSQTVSGFAAINLTFGNVDNNFGFFPGGEIAVLFNRSFYFGLHGQGLATFPTYTFSYWDENQSKNIETSQSAVFWNAGFMVGGVFRAENPIHFGASAKFGLAGVSLFDDYNNSYYKPGYEYYYGSSLTLFPLYTFTPEVNVEMNITYWFKFRLALGYQFVTEQQLTYYEMEGTTLTEKELFNTKGLNTPTLSLGFVFGWFK